MKSFFFRVQVMKLPAGFPRGCRCSILGNTHVFRGRGVCGAGQGCRAADPGSPGPQPALWAVFAPSAPAAPAPARPAGVVSRGAEEQERSCARAGCGLGGAAGDAWRHRTGSALVLQMSWGKYLQEQKFVNIFTDGCAAYFFNLVF